MSRQRFGEMRERVERVVSKKMPREAVPGREDGREECRRRLNETRREKGKQLRSTASETK